MRCLYYTIHCNKSFNSFYSVYSIYFIILIIIVCRMSILIIKKIPDVLMINKLINCLSVRMMSKFGQIYWISGTTVFLFFVLLYC